MERAEVAKELGHFLRTRRERLGPDGGSGRRRTRGLRREEVAEKAAVSREYYTKLEQGRAPNPSSDVLGAVASALLLSSDEVGYVEDLAVLLRGGSVPEGAGDAPDGVGARLVEAIGDRPAFVVDQRLDLTSWNDMTCELLVDLESLPPHHRNLSWLVFTDPRSDHDAWSGTRSRGRTSPFSEGEPDVIQTIAGSCSSSVSCPRGAVRSPASGPPTTCWAATTAPASSSTLAPVGSRSTTTRSASPDRSNGTSRSTRPATPSVSER